MTVIETVSGGLEGFHPGDIESFLGIHCAEPPVGKLRFHAPRPGRPWTGVRRADVCGNHAVQTPLKPKPGLGRRWFRGLPVTQRVDARGDRTGLSMTRMGSGGRPGTGC